MKLRFEIDWLELKRALTAIGKLEKMALPKEVQEQISVIKSTLQYDEFAEQLKGMAFF